MTRTTLLALGAFALAACGQQAQRAETETPYTAEAPAQMQTASMSDAEFIQAAVNIDAYEIQSSELAADRAARQDVKDIATTIVSDNQTTTSELTQLAPTLSIAAPTAILDSSQRASIETLRGAEGEAFDDAYLDAQVEAHENAVRLYENYLQAANTGPLRDWAQSSLSRMRTQLASVQRLEDAT